MTPPTADPTTPGIARKLAVVALLACVAFAGSYVLTAGGGEGPTPAPVPDGQPAALAPVELSLEGHPQADYYLNDPRGQAVRAEFETGWQAVDIGKGDGDVGWIPTLFLWGPTAPAAGDVTEVVDGDGDLLGYWALDGEFTPIAEFDVAAAGHISEIPWPD